MKEHRLPQGRIAPWGLTVFVILAFLLGGPATGAAFGAAADTAPPVVSNVKPSGPVKTTAPTISAGYSDADSGINPASVVVKLDGFSITRFCTVTATGVSCPVSGLSRGTHTIGGSVSDNAGNASPISGSFVVDTTAPSVTNVKPAGTVTKDSVTVSGNLYDAYGIDVSSVKVELDGGELAGCAVYATSFSCPVSGLTNGAHTIGGSVADRAGNVSPITGSFAVSTGLPPVGKPQLSLFQVDVFWGSYTDFTMRQLTVRWSVANSGTTDAVHVRITSSINTNGVSLLTPLPVTLGNVAAAGSASTDLKYDVPSGVTAWQSSTSGSASDTSGYGYLYP